jgi:hypothetical protein
MPWKIYQELTGNFSCSIRSGININVYYNGNNILRLIELFASESPFGAGRGFEMNSHEIMKESVDRVGVKAVAAAMNLSTAMVYKWCEPKGAPDDPGAMNPLDRLLQLYEVTLDVAPIEWLCRKTNGFRVDNPKKGGQKKKVMLESTQTIIKEFSHLLQAVSEGYSNDGRIDPGEAKRIRKEWEALKVVAETFVISCEEGFER